MYVIPAPAPIQPAQGSATRGQATALHEELNLWEARQWLMELTSPFAPQRVWNGRDTFAKSAREVA